MEEKLAAYRARKVQEKAAEQSLVNRLRKSFFYKAEKSDCKLQTQSLPHNDDELLKDDCDQAVGQNDKEIPTQPTSVYWILTILKLLLWLCVWGIFVELQFGAVFFTLSLILFIYFNTRSGNKDNNLSAYSVFNKNCESIQGTVTAEQMQRNMFRVPGLST